MDAGPTLDVPPAWARWIDAVVPPGVSQADVLECRGTALVLAQVALSLVALWLPWGLLVPWVLPALIPLPPLVGLGFLVVRAGRPQLAMHLASAGVLAHWTLLAALTGGVQSPAITGMALAVLFPALTRRMAPVLVWGGIVVVSFALLGLLSTELPPERQPSALFGPFAILTVCASVAVVVLQVVRDAIEAHLRIATVATELAEARDRASSANQAKSAFLAAMSHELRTPMNAVLGVTGILLETELDRTQREFVETIRTSGNALVDIVEDILDFSRIEAGRLRIEAAPFEPVAIARQVADLLRVRAKEQGLRLELEIGEQVPGRLVGDGGRVRQILFNLVGNAVKYTEHGQATLRVLCPERSHKDATVVFEVADSGVGIAPNDLALIFERFTQVGKGLENRASGTGLGLSITKHLVDLMEGTLSVQSEVGKGSTFRVELTLPTEATLVDHEDDALPPLPAARVLVADDNPVNRKVALAMLDTLGVIGDVAGNGELAVRMVQAHRYDVVLMDCEMPILDGYEATRRLRAAGVRTPIIAMTAHAKQEARRKCEDSGMNDFIEKPVRLDTLHRVLVRWLIEA